MADEPQEYKVKLPAREEMVEKVVEELADRLMGRKQYSDEDCDYTTAAIAEKVTENIAERFKEEVDGAVAKAVAAALATSVTPTDEFGSATGPAESLQARLMKRVDAYLAEKVDREGRPTTEHNHYNPARPRIQRTIEMAIAQIVDEQLVRKINEAVAEVKNAAGSRIAEAVRETMKRVLQIPV